MIKNDPQAGTHITINGAASLVLQSKPSKSHEDYTKPVLFLQPEKDKMTPRHYPEKVFKRLGGTNKKYMEIKDAPHFTIEKRYYNQWVEEVDSFIKNLRY